MLLFNINLSNNSKGNLISSSRGVKLILVIFPYIFVIKDNKPKLISLNIALIELQIAKAN